MALRGSALVELGTGLALLVAPSGVFHALIGSEADSTTALMARMLGAALLALGIAGWMAGAPPSAA